VLEIVNSLPFQSRRSAADGPGTTTKPTVTESGNAASASEPRSEKAVGQTRPKPSNEGRSPSK
jgi:hypothetical protein